MTDDQRITRAKHLRRAYGLSYAEIGRRVDPPVDPARVWKWLNPQAVKRWNATMNAKPERRKAKLQWERDNKPLGECGHPISASRRRKGTTQCRRCYLAARAARVEPRRREIVALWAAGATMPEIQERYGWTRGHLANEMARMRAKGYDLPRRPPGGLRRLKNVQQAQHDQDQDHQQEDEQHLRHGDHAKAVSNLKERV